MHTIERMWEDDTIKSCSLKCILIDYNPFYNFFPVVNHQSERAGIRHTEQEGVAAAAASLGEKIVKCLPYEKNNSRYMRAIGARM